VLVPAALEQWAAEHSEQLSADTVAEVERIALSLRNSPIGLRPISEARDVDDDLNELFSPTRAQRASTLIGVVAEWAGKQEAGAFDRKAAVRDQTTDDPADADSFGLVDSTDAVPLVPLPGSVHDLEPNPETTAIPASTLPEPDLLIDQSAFLQSDQVDEEDDIRLYGPKRPWKAISGALVGLAVLGLIAIAGLYLFDQGTASDETTTSSPTPVPAEQSSTEPQVQTPQATPEPTPEPTATPVLPSYWADTTPILNSGTSAIMASTYAVSPANRAVLTGHTAAITDVVIGDDGSVLTSGADRRLVDWGSDVTLADPDVLNVPSPLTVLEQTSDQRLLVGDASGSLSIINVAAPSEPNVRTVHNVAISAAAELADGQFAVASVDGEVAVYAPDDPDNEITLDHGIEVTAVRGLADGRVATAAVDGIVRLWPIDGEGDPEELTTLDSPATALLVLGDGRLATASVRGDIHIVQPNALSPATVVLPGHVGAVRALFELTLPDGTTALASGGDDTTIRLWDIETQTELSVLEGHGDIISGIDVLPDGRLVSTSGDGTGRVWDLTVPPSRPVLPSHDWNLSALHPWNNDQFVSGGVDGKVILSSTSETSEPTVVTEHDSPIVGLSRLQTGQVVSLDTASILRITTISDDAQDQTEIELAPGAIALAVRDSLGVVSGHADGTIRFHDLTEETLVVDAHGSGVNDVVALGSGLVASAGEDNTVRIIDPENPDNNPVFDLHTGPVDVVIELPDGRLASAGSDGIFVYSVEGLAQDHIRLNGQRARTLSLAALPGDRLISTGEDGRIRLWDLNAPDEEPETLVDIPGVVNPHLIQADNGLFVAGAARGYVVFTLS